MGPDLLQAAKCRTFYLKFSLSTLGSHQPLPKLPLCFSLLLEIDSLTLYLSFVKLWSAFSLFTALITCRRGIFPIGRVAHASVGAGGTNSGRCIGLSSVTRNKPNLTAEFLAAEGDKDLQAPHLKRWTYRRCYRAALSSMS
jgi:hypothetical protein